MFSKTFLVVGDIEKSKLVEGFEYFEREGVIVDERDMGYYTKTTIYVNQRNIRFVQLHEGILERPGNLKVPNVNHILYFGDRLSYDEMQSKTNVQEVMVYDMPFLFCEGDGLYNLCAYFGGKYVKIKMGLDIVGLMNELKDGDFSYVSKIMAVRGSQEIRGHYRKTVTRRRRLLLLDAQSDELAVKILECKNEIDIDRDNTPTHYSITLYLQNKKGDNMTELILYKPYGELMENCDGAGGEYLDEVDFVVFCGEPIEGFNYKVPKRVSKRAHIVVIHHRGSTIAVHKYNRINGRQLMMESSKDIDIVLHDMFDRMEGVKVVDYSSEEADKEVDDKDMINFVQFVKEFDNAPKVDNNMKGKSNGGAIVSSKKRKADHGKGRKPDHGKGRKHMFSKYFVVKGHKDSNMDVL